MRYFKLFSDALMSEDQPRKTIMFADMVESAKLKERTAEVNWLPTIGKFLDIATEAVQHEGGEVLKYLGDGVLAVFDAASSGNAIRAGIRLQEQLHRLQVATSLIQNCQCTVGIATGRVVEYRTPAQNSDVIGGTVDLAARLSAAAAPNAVWIDANTFHAADMTRIRSEIGRALDRPTNEYHVAGEVSLKGFDHRVGYYEIIWSQSERGARNATVQDQHIPAHDQDGVLQGTVENWNALKGWGLLRTDHGEFYVNRKLLAAPKENLVRGRTVRFVPLKAPHPNKRPVAGALVQEGSRLTATFTAICAACGYGYVAARDQQGNALTLFVRLGEGAGRLRPGDTARLVVQSNSVALSGRLETSAPNAS
ncbi:adenylate/guanylate cyclase domain-containing protein [Allokutzneria sp. A3M-2-11 16]|uniref:adenylate/guanylate cyclase domain-containing protein n=1 Tax=Allokutzneria sp. A3M-2-11 16 TaxID=2962043 RepID=UPI0020B7913D|nr:adenylate/guanylate cyclase domain-containing protein [Allokutzneria sp. A3M-2-11 16]MCP3802040.1 adenylate/guanylate cyclase domain-containing protein [Allokutzneria sp. A3M-2-11 16]